MEYQLAAMTVQELSLKLDRSSPGEATNVNARGNWEIMANEYLLDLGANAEELRNASPPSIEVRHLVFLRKKQIAHTIVARAMVDNNREMKGQIRLNLLAVLEDDL